MTRKDYVLIASAIRESAPTISESGLVKRGPASGAVSVRGSVCLDIANALADRLQGNNPRFDRERFLRAALGEGSPV